MVEEILESLQEEKTTVFKTNCKYCNQEIKGSSKRQVEYLLLQHKLAKHRDRIVIKEVEK